MGRPQRVPRSTTLLLKEKARLPRAGVPKEGQAAGVGGSVFTFRTYKLEDRPLILGFLLASSVYSSV